jgi:predicted dehydrogenase
VQAFADAFGVAPFLSYAELAKSDLCDICYVGTVHSLHYENVKMCLNNGKHVLCEKPLTLNLEQATELVKLARAKKLFLMEGMWTRCFPAMRKVCELITSGAIGNVNSVNADFGFHLAYDPTHRLFDPNCGGGALLDVGVYPIAFAMMALGKARPADVNAVAQLAPNKVDLNGSVSMLFGDKDSDAGVGGFASLSYSINAVSPIQWRVSGTGGFIEICSPAHAPEKIIVHYSDRPEETHHFPLPTSRPGGTTANFPSTSGFQYEIEEVRQCLQNGLLECPLYSLEETLDLMWTCDTIRGQVGVEYKGQLGNPTNAY